MNKNKKKNKKKVCSKNVGLQFDQIINGYSDIFFNKNMKNQLN